MMKAMTAHGAPYPGLRVYSEQDAAFFFGRDRLRDVIISNLRSSRLTLLFGPSGVGKSSVLRAGVAHELRRLAQDNFDETGTPEFAVAVFNNWRDDPVAGLAAAVEEAAKQTLGGAPIEPPPSMLLADKFAALAERVGGDLLIILDQFEDYFLDREYEEGDGTFAHELARMVNRAGLRVNFLLSIRDDAYSKLDHLKSRISNVYANALRIEHLDLKAARAAIEKPIDQYNRFYAAGDGRVQIEPALVDEVLRTVRTGRLSLGEAGRGVLKRESTTEREKTIEAPFLQLVMSELWRTETLDGSTTLRLQTLNDLGGAREIVGSHLARVMESLPAEERDLAASAFNFLVTSSGNKIPYTPSDLAESTELDRTMLAPLLEKLAGSGRRILRVSVPAYEDGESRYEFAHDVLARAAFAWRTRYRQDQKTEEETRRAAEKARAEERARWAARLRWIKRGLVFAVVLIAASLVVAGYQEIKRRALKASNVSSDIVASLYQVILQPDDKNKSADNLKETLATLNRAVAIYRQDGNPAGEGIALNQIAGLYRAMGQSETSLEHYDSAQGFYHQAEGFYKQARETLKRPDALGPDHIEVANSVSDLAYTYLLMGMYSEAEPLFKQALSIKEAALGSDSRYVADAMINLAECYYAEGKYDEAQQLYEQAAKIRRSKLGDGYLETIQSLTDLASLYLDRGNLREAERCFNEVLDLWKNSGDTDQLNGVPIYDGLAAVYRERGEYEKARQYLTQVQALHQEPRKYDHLLEANDDENQAVLFLKQNNLDQAERLFMEVLRIRENALGSDHPDTVSAVSNIALIYFRQGKQKLAEGTLDDARQIQEALPWSPALARTLHALARLYRDQGRYDEAEPLFQRAVSILEKATPDHPDLAETLNDYADLLRKTNRELDASRLEARASRIIEKHEKE